MGKNHWFLRKVRNTKVNIISAIQSCFRYEVKNRDINVVEWSNIPRFPLLLNGDYEKMLFCGWWNASLQLLPLIYLWITISHFLACLPTLKLTAFEQQVCSTKIGYANALSLGINSYWKRNVATLNSAA